MHLKQCAYVLSEHCHMPNGTDRGFSITIRNRYCSSLYSHCRRELLVNVTGQPFLILDVDDDSKKPTASIETEHGSITSVTRDYSTEKMDVEFLGDRNIFIHVDLQVRDWEFSRRYPMLSQLAKRKKEYHIKVLINCFYVRLRPH